MRIALQVPDVLAGVGLDAALAGLQGLAELELSTGQLPWLYDAGVWYQREPRGEERWLTPTQALERGAADCEDLAAWRAAELVVSGEDPYARAVVLRSGPHTWHAVVSRQDGTFEDPSAALGMGAPPGVIAPVNVELWAPALSHPDPSERRRARAAREAWREVAALGVALGDDPRAPGPAGTGIPAGGGGGGPGSPPGGPGGPGVPSGAPPGRGGPGDDGRRAPGAASSRVPSNRGGGGRGGRSGPPGGLSAALPGLGPTPGDIERAIIRALRELFSVAGPADYAARTSIAGAGGLEEHDGYGATPAEALLWSLSSASQSELGALPFLGPILELLMAPAGLAQSLLMPGGGGGGGGLLSMLSPQTKEAAEYSDATKVQSKDQHPTDQLTDSIKELAEDIARTNKADARERRERKRSRRRR